MRKIASLVLLAVSAVLSGSAYSQVVFFPPKGAEAVNVDTHLKVAFNEIPSVGTVGWIRIFDAGTGECVDSLDMSVPAGPTESRTYAPDIDYTKVPYDYARDSVPTNRNTVPGTPSGTAEPTPPDYQLTIIGGFTDAFHFHPVLVRGNTAVIYPHNNVLEPGRKYRITLDDGVLSVPSGTFRGVRDWSFTTAAETPSLRDTLIVDASGNGDFSTLQGALDAIPDFSADKVVIRVLPGDYEEIVYVRNKSNVVIIGSGADVTRVHYANNEVFNPHPLTVKTNERAGTFPQRRAAVAFDHCSDIVLRDITFATDLTGQAEGLFLNGERIALYGVHIIGDGDALQANGTIYLEGCEVDGGGDTILGRGSLFAYRCAFRNRGGPFTWVRNFKPAHGDVFVECTFESISAFPADYGRCVFNHGSSYTDAEMVVIDCWTRNFNPLGWSALGEPTVVMLEYNTRDMDSGKPVDVSGRHRYSRQLTLPRDRRLLDSYRDPAFVLGGWQPERKADQETYTIDAPAEPMAIRNDHLHLGGISPSGGSIAVNSFYMEMDGKPFIPVLGEFHYSRYPREQWEEQLRKMKAGGINVVPTYVFWNVHEPEEGVFDWDGNKDLRAFVELCGKVGLWSIVRIGPFCHGEMRNGGLPDWLFAKPLDVRSNDALYLRYVGLLYDQVAAQVQGLFYQDGGPVIGVQIENEHQHSAAAWALSYPGEAGDLTTSNTAVPEMGDLHMRTLLSMAKERGIIAPVYTATGWGNAAVLGYDGIPVTAGYPYPVWGDVNAKSGFCLFKDLHKDPDYAPVRYHPEDYPSFSVEMGAGIQIIYDKRPVIHPKGAEAMIVRCLGSGANAIGYYMYQGGSSPLGPDGEEFLSDGNPKVTYDFQAPLGEYGLERPVYRNLRVLHHFIADFGGRLAPMETVLPEGADRLTPDDRETLRYCIRTRDGAGFVFLVNFQDHDQGRHDMKADVDVKLPGESIRIPVRLQKDEVAILPFNFPMGKALLKYATAQPLMRIGDHFFFFAPEGMPAEYVFSGGRTFRPQPGFGSTFRYRSVQVTTLTRFQAEQAVRVGDKILFTDATVLESDGRVTLLNLGSPVFDYTVFDGKGFVPFHREVATVDPAFEVKRVGDRRLTVHFTEKPQPGIHEYFLSLDYTGDVAVGFLENRVIADNLWQGTGPWLIGLNRFSEGLQRDDIGFYFRPLRRQAPFLNTIPASNVPAFKPESDDSVLEIREVKIVPQYEVTVTL